MARGRTVAVRITADTKGLVAGITRAEVNLGNLRKTAVAGTAVLAKMAATGAAFAAGALTAIYARTAPLIDANAKLADRLNFTTEALSGMQLQANLDGVSTEGLTKALEKMSVTIGRAKSEGGLYEKALANIGLRTEDLLSLSADEQYKRIAEGISKLGSASQQASAAQEIFGRSGIQMVNMLRGGASAIEEAQKKAEAYGTALSRVDSAKVEEANDTWTEVREVLSGVANRITVQLAPIVNAVGKYILEAAGESRGFGDAIEKAFNTGIKVVGFFADMVHGLRTVFKGVELVVFTLEASIFEVFKAATQIIATSMDGWILIANEAIKGINKAFGTGFETIDFRTMSSGFVTEIEEMSESSVQHIYDLTEQLQELALQEMPSDSIKAWVQTAIDESTRMAESIAANRAEMFEGEIEAYDEQFEARFKQQEEQEMLSREQFMNSLQAREVAEFSSFQTRLDALKKFHEQGKLSTTQYWASTAQTTTSYLAQMTAVGAQENKKLFRLNKAAAIANAVISTAQGMAKALEWGFPLGPIFAALIGVAGAAQIQSIRSAQFGGGVAPSIKGSTPAIPVVDTGGVNEGQSTGTAAPQRQVNITVNGPVDRQYLRDALFPALQDEINENDVTFINAGSAQARELQRA